MRYDQHKENDPLLLRRLNKGLARNSLKDRQVADESWTAQRPKRHDTKNKKRDNSVHVTNFFKNIMPIFNKVFLIRNIIGLK